MLKNMKIVSLIIFCTAIAHAQTFKQLKVGGGSVPINPAAIVDIGSTNKGMLIPRMSSTQKNAISSPVTGLLVFDTSVNLLSQYSSSTWNNLAISGTTGITSLNSQTGVTQVFANDTNVVITSSNNTHSLGWASTLSLARGGSGASLTAANGAIIYSDAAKLVALPAGTSGQILSSSGAGAPLWLSPVPIASGGTNNSSLGPVLGGLVYSDATKLNILVAGTSGQILSSNGAGAPSWLTGSGVFANTTLSNLGSTAVNADIIPNAFSTINLGSIADPYNNIWTVSVSDYNSTNTAIDVRNRRLTDTSGNPSVTWSSATGVSFSNKKLTSVGLSTGTGTDAVNVNYLNANTMQMLNGQSLATQVFANDTNVIITSSNNTHSLGWTSTLSMARGGSGANLTAVNGGVIVSSAAAMTVLTPGTNGQVLTAGTGGIPAWSTPAASGITSLNSQTGATQVFANDTNILITSSNNTHTLGWGSTLSMARGGTGANLTPIAGGVIFSVASGMSVATPGTAGQYLKSVGSGGNVAWGPGGTVITPTQQIFTGSSSGTYNTPANATLLKITLVGAGGSGGGCLSGTGAGASCGGGGGGTCVVWISSPASTYTYVVGAGGAGAAGAAGNSGTATTFSGSTYSAGGGVHGNLVGMTLAGFNLTASAAGGTSSGCSINIKGGSSFPGITTTDSASAVSGSGGSTTLGPGGGGSAAQGAGNAGGNYGGGGAGCTNLNSPGGTLAGGNGADGIIIVEESY